MLAWLAEIEVKFSDKPLQIIKKGQELAKSEKVIIWTMPGFPPLNPLKPLHLCAASSAVSTSDVYKWQKGNAKLLQRIKINENKFSKLFFLPLFL